MPKEPLDACNIEPYTNEDPSNPNSNSVLYNAMIHPLVRMSIKGALWYQGKEMKCFIIFKVGIIDTHSTICRRI